MADAYCASSEAAFFSSAPHCRGGGGVAASFRSTDYTLSWEHNVNNLSKLNLIFVTSQMSGCVCFVNFLRFSFCLSLFHCLTLNGIIVIFAFLCHFPFIFTWLRMKSFTSQALPAMESFVLAVSYSYYYYRHLVCVSLCKFPHPNPFNLVQFKAVKQSTTKRMFLISLFSFWHFHSFSFWYLSLRFCLYLWYLSFLLLSLHFLLLLMLLLLTWFL